MAVFTNYATLTYNGVSINSNTVTGELPDVLQITKAAVTEEYAAGDAVTYVVSLVNTGAEELAGLTVTDDLGAYDFQGNDVYPLRYTPGSLRFFLDGTLQPAPAVTPGPPLTVTGLSLPAGASALLAYETEVTPYAPLEAGSSVTNTVTAAGAGVGPVTAQATVVPESRAELRVLKDLTPDVAARGSEITYTFTIQNYGSAPASGDSPVLTDLFSPVLSGLQAAKDGIPWVQGVHYTYDGATGLFTTLPGQLAVPAAEFTQGSDGAWITAPGETVVTVTGTI